MLLQVHDELVFEVAPGELDTLKTLVSTEMAGAYELRAPERLHGHRKNLARRGALIVLFSSFGP